MAAQGKPPQDSPQDSRELVLTRLIDAPRAAVYRAWTDPEILKQWFAPRPWTVSEVDLDLRAGGRNFFVMKSPEGEEFPNEGVYLEVVPGKKIVLTDAYRAGWIPSDKPFFTAVVTFEDEGAKTRYTAIARHWRDEDRKTHEGMGFHDGWGQCAAQLEEIAKSL